MRRPEPKRRVPLAIPFPGSSCNGHEYTTSVPPCGNGRPASRVRRCGGKRPKWAGAAYSDADTSVACGPRPRLSGCVSKLTL